MGIYDEYETNTALEESGTKRTYGDFYLILARAGGANKKYSRILKRKTEPMRRAIEIGKLPDDEAIRIMIEVYAEAVVLGWGGPGMVNRDGTPLEFTKENVIRVFTDLPDLFAQVQKDAGEPDVFKAEGRAADAGN